MFPLNQILNDAAQLAILGPLDRGMKQDVAHNLGLWCRKADLNFNRKGLVAQQYVLKRKVHGNFDRMLCTVVAFVTSGLWSSAVINLANAVEECGQNQSASTPLRCTDRFLSLFVFVLRPEMKCHNVARLQVIRKDYPIGKLQRLNGTCPSPSSFTRITRHRHDHEFFCAR